MTMQDTQEEQVVDKIKAGDRDAFQQLVSLYRGKAFGLCYSIVGNVEDAKDILQEAFIKVYKNISRFRKDASFYTWFYAILINTARDYLRKKVQQNKVFIRDDTDLQVSPLSTEKSVLTGELNRFLDSAIRELPEKQRLSFIMKHINGMKIEEIAQILHCRSSTVKVHLFRAVRNLQKRLSPYLTTNQ